MRKILDALLWACGGSMLTFYALMQGMKGMLAVDGNAVSIAEAASARNQFWNIWWWAVGVTMAIGFADIVVRWHSGELTR